MAFSVGDPATDAAVRKLAALRGTTLTETIRDAVEAEFQRLTTEQEARYAERRRKLEELAASLDQYPATGLKADKAFYDGLSGGIDAD
jgi:antitoxin VapB